MKRFLLIAMIALLTLVFVGCSCEFTALYYDVTFYSLNGLEIKTVQVKRNASLTLPSESDLRLWVAERGIEFPADYTYDGLWHNSDGNVVNESDFKRVRNDMSLYGTFELDGEIEFVTATFNAGANGTFEQGLTVIEMLIVKGGSVTPPAVFAYEGYTFIGWDCGNESFINVTSPLTATALYTQKEMASVTFKAGAYGKILSGANLVNEIIVSVEKGGNITPPSVVPNEDYEFIGWDCSEASFINVTASFTANAVYKYKGMVTVTFLSGEGGYFEGGATVAYRTVNAGESVMPPEVIANSDYEFVRWETHGYSFEGVTEDFTAEAVYNYQNKYTVTFKAGAHGKINGGTADITITVNEGGSIANLPVVTPDEGYDFTGWDVATDAFINISSSFVTTAQYEIQTFTVTFEAGSHGRFANGEEVTTLIVNYGAILPAEAVPMVEPNVEGYRFVNWTPSLSDPIKTDTTFVANWEIITYTVTFYNDGKIFNVQTVSHGSDADDPGIPRKNNHRFTGWDRDFTAVTGDLDIYAQYSASLIIHKFYHEEIHEDNLFNIAQYVFGDDITDLLANMRREADEYAESLGEGFYFSSWIRMDNVDMYDEDGNLEYVMIVWVASYSDEIYFAVTFWFEAAEGELVRLGEVYLVREGYVFAEDYVLELINAYMTITADMFFDYFDSEGNDLSYIFETGVDKTMNVIIKLK